MTKKLARDTIKARLDELPNWTLEGDALVRTIECASFADAIAFVTRLAFAAEADDHHPDLLINYKRVTVTWTTHSEDGVTEKDVAGARQSDVIAAMMGVRPSLSGRV